MTVLRPASTPTSLANVGSRQSFRIAWTQQQIDDINMGRLSVREIIEGLRLFYYILPLSLFSRGGWGGKGIDRLGYTKWLWDSGQISGT